jgi:AbrB family looped-hinge helix DNA binding protein
MRSFEVKLSRGQITIPAALRARLHLRDGDKLEFYFDARDRLIVRPRNAPPSAVFENAPKKRASSKHVSDDEAIAGAVAQKDRRSRMRCRIARSVPKGKAKSTCR